MSDMSASPLRSSETFETYCKQVQGRLAEHASQRLNFLQNAYERLTHLLHTAQAVEDTALYNELWRHCIAVRELLESLNQIVSPSDAMASISRAPIGSSPLDISSANNMSSELISSAFVSSAVVTAASVLNVSADFMPAGSLSGAPAAPAGSSTLNVAAQIIALPGSQPANKPGESSGDKPRDKPGADPIDASFDNFNDRSKVESAGPAKAVNQTGSGDTSRNHNAERPPGVSVAAAAIAKSASVPTAQPLATRSLPQSNGGAANGHTNRDKKESAPTPPAGNGNDLQPAPTSESRVDRSADLASRPVRQPVRPLADIEADAARLREALRDWDATRPLRHVDTAGGELDVPNCLRLRAIACRMRRLEEEAGDMEVAEVTELARDIEDLLDEAGDEEYTVALDYEIEPQPTAYQWGELAERYEETAHAEEAFAWWIAHRAVLSVPDVQALAESVAAIQQRFNRLLFRIGARDPFQQQLFDDLRIWAKEAQCYLYSLRPKVPIVELIEKAQTIDAAWEQAREPLREREERENAIQAVIAIVSAQDFGTREDEDRARLQQTLLQCKNLRIPGSEPRLRDVLLPWATFLETDALGKELLQAVLAE